MGYLVFVAALLLSGCNFEKTGTEFVPNQARDDFGIVSLFEVNGCTVYRFNDKRRSHYFTTCKGETLSTQKSGKTTYEESIPTKKLQE